MSSARAACVAIGVGGQLYVFGGSANGKHMLASAERFHPHSNEWTQVPDMSIRRASFGVASCTGKIYAFGGFSGKSVLSSAERFDPVVGHWEHLPPLQVARADFAFTTCSGKIFVMGGITYGKKVLSSVEIFSPEAHCWDFVIPLLHPSAACTAVAINDGVYVFGGADGRQVSHLVQRFDQMSKDWECLPPMFSGRFASIAVVLSVPYSSIIDPDSSETSVTRREPELLRDSHGTGIGNAANNSVDFVYFPLLKLGNRFGGRFCEGLRIRKYLEIPQRF